MSSSVTYRVDEPEKLSRGILLLKTFLGWLYVGIPHGICLGLYGIAMYVVLFISWFAILFTGKFPKGLFDFVVAYQRWSNRVTAYMMLLTDEYPPFNGQE
jgi:hypothetical protein